MPNDLFPGPVPLAPITTTIYDQAIVVGTVPVHIIPLAGQRWIVLRADINNTGTIYVSTNANAIAGSEWPLAKGDQLPVLWTGAGLWVVASAAGQAVYTIAGSDGP